MKKCLMMMCALMALAVAAGVPPVGRTQMNVPADVPINPEIDNSNVRITTLEAYALSWNNATGTYVVDSTPLEMGWKTSIEAGEENSAQVFNGFYGNFNVPVAVDRANGKVSFETGICLDAYKDSVVVGRYQYDTICYLFAVPEIWLLDENADMWQTINGTINRDGTAHFDGGFAYFMVIVANKKTSFYSSLVSSDTTCVLSPVFRNINVRNPNGLHRYELVKENLHLVPTSTCQDSGRQDTDAKPSVSSAIHDGFKPQDLYVDFPILPDGVVPVSPGRPGKPGKPGIGDLIKANVSPSNGNTIISAPNHKNNDNVREDLSNLVMTKDDLSKLIINGMVPKGTGRPRSLDPTDSSCSSDADVALTHSRVVNGETDPLLRFTFSRFMRDVESVIQGLVPRGIPPVASAGPSAGSTIAGAGSSNGPDQMASSSVVRTQFEEPVYISQSPEDNSIRVYNLYGNGFVCNVFDFQEDNSLMLPVQAIGYDCGSNAPIFNCGTDLNTVVELGNVCEITANQISWGATIPFVVDADQNYYYDPSTLTLTDGLHFIVPVFNAGDIDGNGSLNIDDLTALIDRLMVSSIEGEGMPASLGVTDVNKDQQLNIADVTTLIDLMLGGN